MSTAKAPAAPSDRICEKFILIKGQSDCWRVFIPLQIILILISEI